MHAHIKGFIGWAYGVKAEESQQLSVGIHNGGLPAGELGDPRELEAEGPLASQV